MQKDRSLPCFVWSVGGGGLVWGVTSSNLKTPVYHCAPRNSDSRFQKGNVHFFTFNCGPGVAFSVFGLVNDRVIFENGRVCVDFLNGQIDPEFDSRLIPA